MTYYANFCVNNGTMLMNSLSDTNIKRITKKIKDIASSEIFLNNRGVINIYKIMNNSSYVITTYRAVWCHNGVRWYNDDSW